MDLISSVFLAAAALLGATCAKVLADEFKAWVPHVASRIIVAASRKVPAYDRLRWTEEMLGWLDETPGDIGKLVHAAGCYRVVAKGNESHGFLDKFANWSSICVLGYFRLIVYLCGRRRHDTQWYSSAPTMFTAGRPASSNSHDRLMCIRHYLCDREMREAGLPVRLPFKRTPVSKFGSSARV